jgi:hypothetical protein
MIRVRRRRLHNVALARWALVLSFIVLLGGVTAISAWSRGPQLAALDRIGDGFSRPHHCTSV